MTLGIKTGRCRICEKEKETEWHHIISQHHAKKTGQDHLIYNCLLYTSDAADE